MENRWKEWFKKGDPWKSCYCEVRWGEVVVVCPTSLNLTPLHSLHLTPILLQSLHNTFYSPIFQFFNKVSKATNSQWQGETSRVGLPSLPPLRKRELQPIKYRLILAMIHALLWLGHLWYHLEHLNLKFHLSSRKVSSAPILTR